MTLVLTWLMARQGGIYGRGKTKCLLKPVQGVSKEFCPQSKQAQKEGRFHRPGVDWQLRVEHTGRDGELLQEQLEPVAPVYCVDEHDRFTAYQSQFQQRVDQRELILLLTPIRRAENLKTSTTIKRGRNQQEIALLLWTGVGVPRPSSHRTCKQICMHISYKAFDVACKLCEHSHLSQRVPLFAWACCKVLRVLCERGLSTKAMQLRDKYQLVTMLFFFLFFWWCPDIRETAVGSGPFHTAHRGPQGQQRRVHDSFYRPLRFQPRGPQTCWRNVKLRIFGARNLLKCIAVKERFSMNAQQPSGSLT